MKNIAVTLTFLLIFSFLPHSLWAKQWGLYQIFWNPQQYKRELTQELKSFKETPHYLLFFRDLIRPFPQEIINYNHQLGAISIVSLELTIWGKPVKKNYLQEIINGKYDDYFTRWFQAAQKDGRKVIYRFGFEMNGNWFSWGEQPEKFKQAWTHVYRLCQKAKATNVQWMFSPNVIYQNPKSLFVPYYPGNHQVDLLGLDGYNFGDHHDEWHSWSSYQSIFDKSIKLMKLWKKPLFISEIGVAHDHRKPKWIKNFLNRVSRDQSIVAFIYFNYNKTSEQEPNWKIDSHPLALQYFNHWITQGKK